MKTPPRPRRDEPFRKWQPMETQKRYSRELPSQAGSGHHGQALAAPSLPLKTTVTRSVFTPCDGVWWGGAGASSRTHQPGQTAGCCYRWLHAHTTIQPGSQAASVCRRTIGRRFDFGWGRYF